MMLAMTVLGSTDPDSSGIAWGSSSIGLVLAAIFAVGACRGASSPGASSAASSASSAAPSAVSIPSPTAAQVTLQGAGATFPKPLYDVWFQTYTGTYGNVQFNYQAIGSGGGISPYVETPLFDCKKTVCVSGS